MTHVQSQGGVTGFGSLRGQNNAPRFSRPSGASNQDINAEMSAMAAVQKRRRRLLLVEDSERNLSKQKKNRKNRQKGVAGSIPSEGTTTTAMGMPNVGRDTIGHAMYAPKTSTSNVELPPPEVTTSPLDAVKVVDDPKPLIETKDNAFGFGGAPMIGLGPQGGGSAMSGISLLEQTDGPPFTPDEGGGYITTEQTGGVNPQPSPIDLPKRKKKEIDDENLVLLSTLTKTKATSNKGFTTAMFASQTPTNTAMAPNAPFDAVNQIARAYGIQGSMSTTQLPLSLSMYGGKEYIDGKYSKAKERHANGAL